MSLFDAWNYNQQSQTRARRQQTPGLPQMTSLPASRGAESFYGLTPIRQVVSEPPKDVAPEDVMDYSMSQKESHVVTPQNGPLFLDEQLGQAQRIMAVALTKTEDASVESVVATDSIVDDTAMSWETQMSPDSVDTTIPIMGEYSGINPNGIIRGGKGDIKREQKYTGSKNDPWGKGRIKELPNKNKGENVGVFTGASGVAYASSTPGLSPDQSDIVEETSRREGAFLLAVVLVGCAFFLYKNYR